MNSMAMGHDWDDTHEWCGLLCEEMHRGQPVERGIVIAVLQSKNGTTQIAMLPSRVMAMSENDFDRDHTMPSVGLADEFRAIPTLTASNPRGLGPQAWVVTDQHGCQYYVEPTENTNELSADDVIAIIRNRSIGDWFFTAERLKSTTPP